MDGQRISQSVEPVLSAAAVLWHDLDGLPAKLRFKPTSAEAGVMKWDLNRPARVALKVAQAEVPKGPSPGLQPTPDSSPAKGDTCPRWWGATWRPSRA